jgi:hypothetical protein
LRLWGYVFVLKLLLPVSGASAQDDDHAQISARVGWAVSAAGDATALALMGAGAARPDGIERFGAMYASGRALHWLGVPLLELVRRSSAEAGWSFTMRTFLTSGFGAGGAGIGMLTRRDAITAFMVGEIIGAAIATALDYGFLLRESRTSVRTRRWVLGLTTAVSFVVGMALLGAGFKAVNSR